jgi:hypothetical protein
MLCTALTQAILATSDEGVHALSLFWRRFKLFLPIWGEPRRLTKEVGVNVFYIMLCTISLYCTRNTSNTSNALRSAAVSAVMLPQ